AETDIRRGLAQVEWPGRMELLRLPGGPAVLLDAAHNPAKCGALAEAIRDYFPGRAVLLVLGALADKNVAAMAAPLLAVAGRVWTTTPESQRRMEAGDLAAVCRGLGSAVTVEPSVHGAVDQALAAACPGDLVVITGSFYTVGPARRHIRQRIDEHT
ncbi:MAG TPA: cyanophycin synthetase, partial [Symbiobacteriaceae bacterium]|nr:cyanophycin synthetase [Symbiobacteriaceae bacterium]